MTTTAVAVRERPIIMTGESVRAILDGRKSQTRRVITTPLPDGVHECHWNEQGWAPATVNELGGRGCSCKPLRPFYGAPGDRLWVRDTWAYFGGDEYLYQREPSSVRYRASDEVPGAPTPGGRWRSPRFMPRWASRLTLEVTGVRVERVQDIHGHDAQAEGINAPPSFAREEYARLWDSLNAARGFGWDANPYVWVIEFRRVEGE